MFHKMKKPADQHRSNVRSQTKAFRAMKVNPCVHSATAGPAAISLELEIIHGALR